MLDLFDDANIYQTWSYGAVRWGRDNLSHIVLRRNDEVLGMAQLRIKCPTNLKFGMAYLSCGPICQRRGSELDVDVLSQMATALQEEYVFKRKLLLQILPNAFSGSPRAEGFQSAFSGFTQEPRTSANTDRTLVLDLNPSIEELRKKLDPKWRNKLVGAEKNDLRVITGCGIDEYGMFCRMYKEMRNRKTFESTLDVEEFGRIQDDLPESHRLQIFICEQQGVPVAGVVASVMGDSAIYLLGATADKGLHAKGSYLLQWTLIRRLKENGIKWYDLGGIDPERNPGVYYFKRGLSGTDTCQLPPFVACNSVFSSAVVKAGMVVHRAVRGWRSPSFKLVHVGRFCGRNS